jgi:hypothetical protein
LTERFLGGKVAAAAAAASAEAGKGGANAFDGVDGTATEAGTGKGGGKTDCV